MDGRAIGSAILNPFEPLPEGVSPEKPLEVQLTWAGYRSDDGNEKKDLPEGVLQIVPHFAGQLGEPVNLSVVPVPAVSGQPFMSPDKKSAGVS